LLESTYTKLEGSGTTFQTWEVAGLAPALFGMRNPKDSWDKGDSEIDLNVDGGLRIGPKDMQLAQTLIDGGSCHCKFLRDIIVWVDITGPLYFWTELDTYKVGTVRNSCSTMHTLIKKINALPPSKNTEEEILSLFALEDPDTQKSAILGIWAIMWDYLQYHDVHSNSTIRYIKQLLPDSYIQRSMYLISYQGLRNVIQWRQTHRLVEWNTGFINWVKTLPYADEFIFYKGGR